MLLARKLGHFGGKHHHRLGHGNFLPWIEAEFSMGEQTARNFMSVAATFSKSPTVGDLPATVLYQLVAPSTPEPIREEFMREAEAAGGATAEPLLEQQHQSLTDEYHQRERGHEPNIFKALAHGWLLSLMLNDRLTRSSKPEHFISC